MRMNLLRDCDAIVSSFGRRRIAFGAATVLALAVSIAPANAQNLLLNGGFEPSGGEVPSWTLNEFVTGSATILNTAELGTSTAAQSPTRHLWLRPFAGGQTAGPDNLTNAELIQTVPISAGQEYTFSGYSRFEVNYGGGVETLGSDGPLGAVASPTVTQMSLEFLDASDNIIGSPFTLDVEADRIAQIGFPDPNDNAYYQHLITQTAPSGATQARVTAAAYDMVWNIGPAQSMFYDTFSVTATSDPSTELLLNPTLDENPSVGFDGWTVVNDDPGNPMNEEVVRTATFANAVHSGVRGLWFSSFFGELETPVSGSVSQTVEGVAGGEYTFSGWSLFEANFPGGQDTLAGGPGDGQPSPTEIKFELAFLDGSGVVIGTPAEIDIKADRTTQAGGNPNDTNWYQHSVSATAPAGTVDVRVSAIFNDGVLTTNPQSGMFDDFELTLATTGTPGDFDGDDDVDGQDFLVWQAGFPGTYDAGDLADWQSNYGTEAPAAGSVPEPTTLALAACGMAAAVLRRRRA